MGSFSFADDFGVSRSRLVDPKLNLLAVSHRSGDNFAAKRVARVQIPPSPRESKKEPDFQALFYFADDFGVSRSRLVDPKLNLLAVSHRSGDNFAAKRVARVQIPPSPRGRRFLLINLVVNEPGLSCYSVVELLCRFV